MEDASSRDEVGDESKRVNAGQIVDPAFYYKGFGLRVVLGFVTGPGLNLGKELDLVWF